MTNRPITNWIDGEARPSSSGVSIALASPVASLPESLVPQSDIMDVVAAVSAQNRALAPWLKESVEVRNDRLLKATALFRAKVESHADDLAVLTSTDTGMPVALAMKRSVVPALTVIDRVLDLANRTREKPAAPPLGATAVLLGWTNPLVQFVRRVLPVMLAGCPVCLKPSSKAPRTLSLASGLWIAAMKEAQVPTGLFACLNGTGAGEDHVGELLLRHPAFKSVEWVGRTDSALLAQVIAHEGRKRFRFSGSGHNPALLFGGFDSVQLDAITKSWARAVSDPHGLGPYRPSRLFVHDSIYQEMIERLSSALTELKPGHPLDASVDLGALLPSVGSAFDRQVAMALGETGRLVVGGKRDGNLAQATLIRDLTNCSTLQGEELAGPWATIASFKYAHEALKYANTSPLGLAAYVIHPDLAKAKGTAEKLEASRVFFSPEPPWPEAIIHNAPPVKNSSNAVDGIDSLFHASRHEAYWF